MRVSVTDIDAYKWWCENDGENLKKIKDRLLRRSQSTEAMTIGNMVHRALQNAEDEISEVSLENLLVQFGDFSLPLSKRGLRELKLEKSYETSYGELNLVGIVDYLNNSVYDYKTTSNPIDLEKYSSTYQWRLYLDMSGFNKFTWIVFRLKTSKKKPDIYKITEMTEVSQYSYPEMKEDINSKLDEFHWFINNHIPEYSHRSK